jgi:hypothetical protein
MATYSRLDRPAGDPHGLAPSLSVSYQGVVSNREGK